MHYIPFINENPRNRDNDFDCRDCPCFIFKFISNNVMEGSCIFNNSRIETFESNNEDIINDRKTNVKLQAAITRNCTVRYRDPVEGFKYLQFMSIVNNDFYNYCKELSENKNLSDEERKVLTEKRDKTMQLSQLMGELYPKFEYKTNKIMLEGYKMDENGKLFK